MWSAIVGIIGWFKSLLGGKLATQIGSGNQAVSGSTTGDNSPMITVGRDVHFNVAGISQSQPTGVFIELESLMPDLLDTLRARVNDNPLIRDIIVLNRETIGYSWPFDHLLFSADKHPPVWSEIQILENHGLVSEVKDRFAYRMSEELVRYLRSPK